MSQFVAFVSFSLQEAQSSQWGGTALHVQGTYSKIDNPNYIHIVGNGTSENNKSNAHTLDKYGNATFAGDVNATDANGNLISLLELNTNSLPTVSITETSFTITSSKIYRIGHLGFINLYIQSKTQHTGRIQPISISIPNSELTNNQVLSCASSTASNSFLSQPLGCFVSTGGKVYIDAGSNKFYDAIIGGVFYIN